MAYSNPLRVKQSVKKNIENNYMSLTLVTDRQTDTLCFFNMNLKKEKKKNNRNPNKGCLDFLSLGGVTFKSSFFL